MSSNHGQTPPAYDERTLSSIEHDNSSPSSAMLMTANSISSDGHST